MDQASTSCTIAILVYVLLAFSMPSSEGTKRSKSPPRITQPQIQGQRPGDRPQYTKWLLPASNRRPPRPEMSLQRALSRSLLRVQREKRCDASCSPQAIAQGYSCTGCCLSLGVGHAGDCEGPLKNECNCEYWQ